MRRSRGDSGSSFSPSASFEPQRKTSGATNNRANHGISARIQRTLMWGFHGATSGTPGGRRVRGRAPAPRRARGLTAHDGLRAVLHDKPEGEGTGLGLTVARGIIEGHGSAISVESRREPHLARRSPETSSMRAPGHSPRRPEPLSSRSPSRPSDEFYSRRPDRKGRDRCAFPQPSTRPPVSSATPSAAA